MQACKTHLPSPTMVCCSRRKLFKIPSYGVIYVDSSKLHFCCNWQVSIQFVFSKGGSCGADKSDLSSLPTTSVRCSVLFPFKKEGGELGATSPDVVQISSSTSCRFVILVFFARSQLYIKQLSYMMLMVVTLECIVKCQLIKGIGTVLNSREMFAFYFFKVVDKDQRPLT